MPLEGNLKSLNLVAVLQLISNERMTGILHIRNKSDIVCIGFNEGMITGAFYEKGGRQERLENYLIKSGMISQENFNTITKIQESSHQPIVNLLIENNYLKQEQVEMVIRFKIQEVLDEVFIWLDGNFKFEENKIIYPKSMIKIKLNTEGVILEGMRRIDEWPRITKVVASEDLVFKLREKPEAKIEFTEEEKRVYDLIDGKRTVSDIINLGGLGRFRTYSALFHLHTIGQTETYYVRPIIKDGISLKFSIQYLLVPIEILLVAFYLTIIIGLGIYLRQHHLIHFDSVNIAQYNNREKDYREVFYMLNNRLPTPEELKENFE